MGLFPTRSQRFGDGYDPVTHTMSLSGPSGATTQAAPADAPARHAFFGEGGAGRNIAGYIGDALLNLSGGHPLFAPLMQQRQLHDQTLADQMAQAQAKREADQAEVRAVPLGNGGFGTFSPASGLHVLREPTIPEKISPLEQQIEYLRKLDPTLTPHQLADIAQRNMSGFRYSPDAYQQQLGVVAARGAESRRTKALPTFGNLHPRSTAPKPPAGFILD